MPHILCNFFCETSNHPGDSAPLQPRFGALWLLTLPQTKITFEMEEISDHRWDSGEYDTAADGDWESCVRSQGAYFEGDWGVIVLWTMFLVSCIFNKCLYFSYYMAGYLLDRPYTHLSIITLKVNVLNASTKRHRVAEWIRKDPTYAAYKRPISDRKTYIDLMGKKKIFHANDN